MYSELPPHDVASHRTERELLRPKNEEGIMFDFDHAEKIAAHFKAARVDALFTRFCGCCCYILGSEINKKEISQK